MCNMENKGVDRLWGDSLNKESENKMEILLSLTQLKERTEEKITLTFPLQWWRGRLKTLLSIQAKGQLVEFRLNSFSDLISTVTLKWNCLLLRFPVVRFQPIKCLNHQNQKWYNSFPFKQLNSGQLSKHCANLKLNRKQKLVIFSPRKQNLQKACGYIQISCSWGRGIFFWTLGIYQSNSKNFSYYFTANRYQELLFTTRYNFTESNRWKNYIHSHHAQ